MNNLRKKICKWFGHSFDSVELLALDIMQNEALNKEVFKGRTINCKRCKTPCSFTKNMVGLYENEAEFDLI